MDSNETTGARSARTWMTVAVIVLVIAVAVAVVGYIVARRSGGQASVGDAMQTATPTPQSVVGMKLADAPFADRAYLISTDPLSAEAQQALVGFSVSHTASADGSVTYTLQATNPEYQDQRYTLAQGEQLYFIELSGGDDASGAEENPRDDHAVVVDATGTIVR